MGGPPKVVPPWGMCALEEGERERLNHLFMKKEKKRKKEGKREKRGGCWASLHENVDGIP